MNTRINVKLYSFTVDRTFDLNDPVFELMKYLERNKIRYIFRADRFSFATEDDMNQAKWVL